MLNLSQLSEEQSSSLKAIKPKVASQAAVSNMTKVHHIHSGGERERTKPNGHDAVSPHSVLLMDAFNPPSAGDYGAHNLAYTLSHIIIIILRTCSQQQKTAAAPSVANWWDRSRR